jgi:two-component system chemotaxis response regulator CheB
MDPSFNHVVVIGASAGGVSALLQIGESLPPQFPRPVCVVQHIGSHPACCRNCCVTAAANARACRDGQRLGPGTLHVARRTAPAAGRRAVCALRTGRKENHARPAIDPCSAAPPEPRAARDRRRPHRPDGRRQRRPAAVKDCGGIAIVQDPASAEEPEMPRSALADVAVDHCVPLEEMARCLQRLVGVAAPAPAGRRRTGGAEVAINLGMRPWKS